MCLHDNEMWRDCDRHFEACFATECEDCDKITYRDCEVG